jgi:transcriptional regulator with XRE-family HTH domain
MEDVRIGLVIRAVRRRRTWRQSDLAKAAGVSQQTVSRIETGHLDEMGLRTLRGVAAALQVSLRLDARWRGPELAALVDERHSGLVELVVRRLADCGWRTVVEYTFNLNGERGSVDVLAWHDPSRALLVIEVKTSLLDLQETLSTFDRKVRVVRATALSRFGWRPAAEASVLVLADDSALRGAVSRRSSIFATSFPARTVEVRRWLANPDRPLRGLWFLSDTPPGGGMGRRGGSRRVRRSRTVVPRLSPRSSERHSVAAAAALGPGPSPPVDSTPTASAREKWP